MTSRYAFRCAALSWTWASVAAVSDPRLFRVRRWLLGRRHVDRWIVVAQLHTKPLIPAPRCRRPKAALPCGGYRGGYAGRGSARQTMDPPAFALHPRLLVVEVDPQMRSLGLFRSACAKIAERRELPALWIPH